MARPSTQKKRGFRWAAVMAAVAVGIVAAVASSAFADQVVNTLDTTIDPAAESMSLTVGASNGSVQYYLLGTNGDAKNGCNLTGSGSQLVVDLSSDNTGVATVTSSLTITACGDATLGPFVTASVHPVAAGSATITATFHSVSTSSAATSSSDYDMAPATFAVNVSNPTPTNHAPTTPGNPSVATGTSPRADGNFTVSWTASTDQDSNDTVSYTLEHHNASTSTWTTVASGLTTNSYTFGGSNAAEGEGTWSYRVKATDNHGLDSAGYGTSSNLVKVDETAPNAPTAAATTPAAYTDGSGNSWWKDTVTVSFSVNGDQALADTSAGSGVDASTLPNDQTFTTLGKNTASGTVKDNVGNESSAGTLDVYVDNSNPTFGSCPAAGPFMFGSGDQTVGPISTDDTGSGVASTGNTLSGTVHTNVATQQSVMFTVYDNVGHSATKTCYYDIVSTSFLKPIDAAPIMNIAKLGRVIPVKINLNLDGSSVDGTTTQPIYLTGATKVSCSTGEITPDSTIDLYAAAGSSNAGNLFRWDTTGGYWIYNYDTSAWKLAAGNCYRINVYYGGTANSSSIGSGGALAGYFLLNTTK